MPIDVGGFLETPYGVLEYYLGNYPIIGTSEEGRNIRLVNLARRPKLLVVAGVHGDEISGVLACLMAIEKYKHQRPPLALIPCANPDGLARFTRENYNGIDINRSFPPLGNGRPKETWTIIRVLRNLGPEMVLDLHELGLLYFPKILYFGQDHKNLLEILRSRLGPFTGVNDSPKTPGSLGCYLLNQGIPCVVLELPLYVPLQRRASKCLNCIQETLNYLEN